MSRNYSEPNYSLFYITITRAIEDLRGSEGITCLEVNLRLNFIVIESLLYFVHVSKGGGK